MNRQRLLVLAAIAAVIGVGIWLLWPRPTDQIPSAVSAGPYLVRMAGPPPQLGVSAMTVEVLDAENPVPPPDSVTFEPAMPQMGHAETPVAAAEYGAGRYRGDLDLSMPGQWAITVRITAGQQVHEAVLHVTTSG